MGESVYIELKPMEEKFVPYLSKIVKIINELYRSKIIQLESDDESVSVGPTEPHACFCIPFTKTFSSKLLNAIRQDDPNSISIRNTIHLYRLQFEYDFQDYNKPKFRIWIMTYYDMPKIKLKNTTKLIELALKPVIERITTRKFKLDVRYEGYGI